jgi:hypothetical protein
LSILPDIRPDNIAQFLNKEEIVKATIAQIIKDFDMHGVTVIFTGTIENAYPELLQKLSSEISFLLVHDYSRLLSILYQVDITEKEIAKAQQEFHDYNHAEILAHQIIVRDLKKVLLRQYYKSKNQ